MAVYKILPQVNLKAEDVRDTLNSHGGSVNNDLLTFFTAAAKINPMSKNKPERDSALFRDFGVHNAMMGFKATSYTSYTQIVSAMDDNMNGWVYELPRGGAYNEPFRLGDFRGYAPNADPMIYEQYLPDKGKKGNKVYFEATVAQDGTTGIIFSDFAFLSGYYFGVYIVGQTSGMSQWVVTTSTAVGVNALSVEIDTTNFAVGKYKVYPFLSKNKITLTQSYTAANTYYTIPLMKTADFEVTSTDANAPKIVGLEAYYVEGSKTNIKYNFTINNGSPNTKVTGLVVKVKRYDLGYNDADSYGYEAKLSDVTLGSNGTYTKGLTSITVNSALYDYGAKIWVYGVYSNGNQAMIASELVAVTQPE